MQILSKIMARFHGGKEEGSSSEEDSTEESNKDDEVVQKYDKPAVQEDDVANAQGDKEPDVQAWEEATPQKEQAVKGGAKAPGQ